MSINNENLIQDYPVHKAVFNNDLQTLKKLFTNDELAKKDRHGTEFGFKFDFNY